MPNRNPCSKMVIIERWKLPNEQRIDSQSSLTLFSASFRRFWTLSLDNLHSHGCGPELRQVLWGFRNSQDRIWLLVCSTCWLPASWEDASGLCRRDAKWPNYWILALHFPWLISSPLPLSSKTQAKVPSKLWFQRVSAFFLRFWRSFSALSCIPFSRNSWRAFGNANEVLTQDLSKSLPFKFPLTKI